MRNLCAPHVFVFGGPMTESEMILCHIDTVLARYGIGPGPVYGAVHELKDAYKCAVADALRSEMILCHMEAAIHEQAKRLEEYALRIDACRLALQRTPL